MSEPTRKDKDFDEIAVDFESDVYGTTKGLIRSQVIWDDMATHIPGLSDGKLSVLDAGGGSGQLALQMARAGNEVLLCDPSEKMLSIARKAARETPISGNLTFLHAPIQDLERHLQRQFQLVVCHAVLEWLANPEDAIRHLAKFLDPSGTFSLMFYNHNAALFKRAARGQFKDALREADAPAAPRVDGAIPLRERAVHEWLGAAGLEVQHRAGIRVFHDHVRETLDQGALADLLALELRCRTVEPFASLAQHIHLLCRRGGT